MSGSTHDFDHVLADLGSVLRSVDEREVAALQQAILDAPSTHAAGEGRSGLVARAFAARLAHLGRKVHVIGDATSPPLGRDDLLLICSASGTCGSMKLLAEHAIQAGARVALVTAGVISSLARLADLRVNLPPVLPAGASGEEAISDTPPTAASLVLPLRILFEQSAFLLLDALATRLMHATGQKPSDLEARMPELD